ncbi:MAG: GNVR domain-containing protein [Candidatus Omnitrophota bacterium]
MNNIENAPARSPAEYLKIFFRNKWLIISTAWIGLIIGVFFSLTLAPKYQSSAVILIQEEKAINPLMQGLAISSSVEDRMKTIKEQLLGWNSLVSLTKKLNLDKQISSQQAFESLVLGLRKDILVAVRGRNLIQISYIGKNPQETQLIAKTMTDILLEENMRAQTQETDVAINFIKEQLELYKRKIKESEAAELEDQLKKLLVDSTEEHPLVKDLRQKIATIKKELSSGEYEITVAGKPVNSAAATALKQELEKMTLEASNTPTALPLDQNARTDPNTAIYKLMLMDKLDSVLARDTKVNENIYNLLLQKLETAKITQRLESSKIGTRYTIIDPPRLPLSPTQPNKPLVIFLGLLGGLGVGIGLIFAREFLDSSFLDLEEAKAILDVPVLGAISRLTTEEEINKERAHRQKLITIGAIASATTIVIALLYYLLRK